MKYLKTSLIGISIAAASFIGMNALATGGMKVSPILPALKTNLMKGHKNVNLSPCNAGYSNICIYNSSNQRIYFSVPAYGPSYQGWLPSGYSVDNYTSGAYGAVNVTISNNNGYVVFSQPVPNNDYVVCIGISGQLTCSIFYQ